MADDKTIMIITVTKDLNQKLNKAAKDMGLTKASWIRSLAIRELAKLQQQ